MRDFRFIAMTPSTTVDPSIAIAANRAGELGILDLEYAETESAAREAIDKLVRSTGGSVGGRGVKLDGGSKLAGSIASELPPGLHTVLLAFPDRPSGELLRYLKQQKLEIIIEVRSLQQALVAEEWGVDGLIAKGNESGGHVGEETSFILLQRLIRGVSLPIWVQGGIGLHTVGAAYAAGASGVVLDAQLALSLESSWPETAKAIVAGMDGSETVCFGDELGELYRIAAPPRHPGPKELARIAESLARDSRPAEDRRAEWCRVVREKATKGASQQRIWLLGQDAAFASPLAERYRTVGRVLMGMRQAVSDHVGAAQKLQSLAENGPLAESQGTRFPIVQGPMTRVSDRAGFAVRVAEGGALPFLALALMRGPEVKALLADTRAQLGERPWGVGILGFVPPELRQEQLEVIRDFSPPYVLIAGGRPDQARALEQVGIATYLHVPSPGLLRMFLEDGARRFVFEGRECGGHVGPRSSFVLWNTMVDVLLDSLGSRDLRDCHVLFAGGIHDGLSAAMVATLAAPLAERGARIGVLLGTAYLFTEEAVAEGAIVEGFQKEAIRCSETVLLETGPGHATRCATTPFADEFKREKLRLSSERASPEEVREKLESLNLGRLRIASKGISRNPTFERERGASKFVTLEEGEQHREGMYMIGQVAALRDHSCTIDGLHEDVARGCCDRLAGLAKPEWSRASLRASQEESPSNIAIVGMACLLPKAPNLEIFWNNVLGGINSITEIPEDRWDWRSYFDSNPGARDKVYSKWGGFLDPIPFDPARYGMPPNALASIEPLQILTLEAVRAAIRDAGYEEREYPRHRTSVIVGVGGGVGDLGQQYNLRAGLPDLTGDLPPSLKERLPEWTEDSFPGILLNVVAGRVANRFNFGGVNYTVDAACASSLAALYHAVRELEAGSSDMVIVGGADTVQNPFAYLCFSKIQALSPRGQCRPFDATADGTVISEGVVFAVLKRLADAERDGDRIYAVIKGVAGSSHGRSEGLTAPSPEGQVLALARACAKSGVAPSTVQLIEAHGAGTVAGDRAEVEALMRWFDSEGGVGRSCAIGSVKSMIGHTKSAAGMAGLAKVALALHQRLLPPTLGVEKPNPVLDHSGIYANTELRPWIGAPGQAPRRAGVSSFGLGGSNFHAVVEEYTGVFEDPPVLGSPYLWPTELCLFKGGSTEDILKAIDRVERGLAEGARPALCELAYALYEDYRRVRSPSVTRTMAVVASSVDELGQKLARARELLSASRQGHFFDPAGIYFTESPLLAEGKLCFLFPGQGSQYVNMLRDLTMIFPEVRETLERADRILHERCDPPLGSCVFPPPAFDREQSEAQRSALTQTNIAQPALGAVETALLRLLQSLGVEGQMVGGHSYGEYVGLHAAGVIDEETLFRLSEARGRSIVEAASDDLGTMAAVQSSADELTTVLESVEGVWIANRNSPQQTIISGTRPGIARAVEKLQKAGLSVNPVSVACAFHSPLVQPAQQRLAEVLSTIQFTRPFIEVFSNTTAAPYPHEPSDIIRLLSQHLVRPVRFAEEVEAMYSAGARVFVEVGPRNILTNLTRQILDGRAHAAIPLDIPAHSGITTLQRALGQLAVHGLPLGLERFFKGRNVRRQEVGDLLRAPQDKPLPPTAWWVNGGKAWPVVARKEQNRRASSSSASAELGVERSREAGRSSLFQKTAGDSYVGEGDKRPGLVMLRFQELMNRFLETERNVMLRCLERGSPTPQRVGSRALSPKGACREAVSLARPSGVTGQVIDSKKLPSPETASGPFLRQPKSIQAARPPVASYMEAAVSGDDGELSTPPEEVSLPPVERFTLRAVERPRPAEAMNMNLAPGGVVVVTDDGRGVAESVAQTLRRQGHPVAMVQAMAEKLQPEAGRYGLDLRSEEQIRRALELIRDKQGPIAGLFHLLPLGGESSWERLGLSEWRDRLNLEVRSLFLMTKGLAGDLAVSAEAGGAAVLAASRMGGTFASDPAHGGRSFFPGQGALTGLLKTVAEEFPGVRVKAVDLDPEGESRALADQILAELSNDDPTTEVGYAKGRRVTLEPVLGALSGGKSASLGDQDWVWLITGGARGITAEVALWLAERYKPTLVLVGKSKPPAEEEPPDTAGLSSPGELKTALAENLRSPGRKVSPADVEKAYRRLVKEREIRRNLAAMAKAGARVDYYSVDVVNEQAFGGLIQKIYREQARIDAVIHGAGIIEDKWLKDKSVESFDRVFGAKADSVFILSRYLQPESLRFLVLFSSISGRFGNRGQADYAAANELVNKMAIYLDRRWPGRVVSINWGPWEKSGMVSAELYREFRRRGVALIPPREGRRRLEDELAGGRKGEVEVIVGNGPWTRRKLPPVAGDGAYPLLVHSTEMRRTGETVECLRKLDPQRDVFLRDHMLKGKPVLPLAMAAELVAEVVQKGWPDLVAVEIRDLQLLKGIVIEEDTFHLRVVAQSLPASSRDGSGRDVGVEITSEREPYLTFYRATVRLSTHWQEDRRWDLPGFGGMGAFPLSTEQAYAQWLFHGHSFQRIRCIDGISEKGMIVRVTAESPNGGPNGHWLFDPFVLDVGPQLALLWARATHDLSSLPSGFRLCRRFPPPAEAATQCHFQIQSMDAPILRANVYFTDGDGRPVMAIEDLEASCSRALNELMGRRVPESS